MEALHPEETGGTTCPTHQPTDALGRKGGKTVSNLGGEQQVGFSGAVRKPGTQARYARKAPVLLALKTCQNLTFIEQYARARYVPLALAMAKPPTRGQPATCAPKGACSPPLLGDGSSLSNGTSISAMRPDQITLRRCAPSSRWCPPTSRSKRPVRSLVRNGSPVQAGIYCEQYARA